MAAKFNRKLDVMTVTRDYSHFERYLNELVGDIYPQPPDEGHQEAIEDICNEWLSLIMNGDIPSILDIGCGQGQAIPELQRYSKKVVGVTLGSDAEVCRDNGFTCYNNDMSFLPFADGEFHLIFARHVLEHSPAPLLTLMEWHRIADQFLVLVVPKLEVYTAFGQNHYYVLTADQWMNLLERAGWNVLWVKSDDSHELRFFCEKVRRLAIQDIKDEEEDG